MHMSSDHLEHFEVLFLLKPIPWFALYCIAWMVGRPTTHYLTRVPFRVIITLFYKNCVFCTTIYDAIYQIGGLSLFAIHNFVRNGDTFVLVEIIVNFIGCKLRIL